jgi:hypothetical protein
VDLGADDLPDPAPRGELGLGYTIATVARHRWIGRVRHAAGDPGLPLLKGEASILRFESLALGQSLKWHRQDSPGQGLPRTRQDAYVHARWFRQHHGLPVTAFAMMSSQNVKCVGQSRDPSHGIYHVQAPLYYRALLLPEGIKRRIIEYAANAFFSVRVTFGR